MFTPPLEIHVQGISQVQRPAERGNLVIAVIAEGTSQTTVAAQVTKTSNNLQALFKQLSTKPTQSSSPPNSTIDEPPVTQYSTTNLRTRSWQIPDPNNEGEKISLHEASSHFEVTFRDFEKFAEVSSDLFVTPNTEIRSTTWSLTEEMQKEVGIQGRKMAMRDAISKAGDYARVLGRKVMATEVRGDGTTLKAVKKKGFAAMVPRRGVGSEQKNTVDGLALEPQNVEITEKIQVRFVSVD